MRSARVRNKNYILELEERITSIDNRPHGFLAQYVPTDFTKTTSNRLKTHE